LGAIEECLVEGFNKATGQWMGRTSQHKTVNFLHPAAEDSLAGQYVDVRVTRSGANSLVGEYVS
jgi:tRNA-2-methylthio-N6-dimethylallyladenosine synthase